MYLPTKFKHLINMNIVLMPSMVILLVSILTIILVKQNDIHELSKIQEAQNDLKDVVHLMNKILVMDEQILRVQSLSLCSRYDRKEMKSNYLNKINSNKDREK